MTPSQSSNPTFTPQPSGHASRPADGTPPWAATPWADDPPRHRTTYPANESAPSRARRDVTDLLHSWGLAHARDSLTVIVSELVTNAFTHTGSQLIGVCLIRTGERTVRLVVTDTSRRTPTAPNSASSTASEDD